MSKGEGRRGYARPQPVTPAKVWEDALARHDATKRAWSEAGKLLDAARSAARAAHPDRLFGTDFLDVPKVEEAANADLAARVAFLGARDGLMSTPPPSWGAFAAKLRVLVVHADDVLDPLSPETARALAEEPDDWQNTRRAREVYLDAVALHEGRPRGDRSAEQAALTRLEKAEAAAHAASAAIEAAIGAEPAWPDRLTIKHPGFVQHLSTVGEIVDHFGREEWDQLTRLAHRAQAVRHAWLDRTPRDLASAEEAALEERESARDALLEVPAATATIMPRKVAALASWIVPDMPAEMDAFDVTREAHVTWAQSLGTNTIDGFVAIGCVVLYLDALALSQREG